MMKTRLILFRMDSMRSDCSSVSTIMVTMLTMMSIMIMMSKACLDTRSKKKAWMMF